MKTAAPAKRKKSRLGSLGRHLRDVLINAFPVEMRTPTGLTVRLRNRSEFAVYRNIFVERVYPLDAFAGEIGATPAPVVFDVGANNGQFAAAIFDRWPQARVHSFEPQKNLVPRIREFADINGLQDRHVVNWCAIGASAGEADFFQNRSPVSASLLREKAARRTVRRVYKVPVKTLDDYAQTQGIRQVDILKLDVEGVELDALRGARQVLGRVRLMFLEVHPPFSTFSQAAALLQVGGLACVNPATTPDDSEQANCVFARRPEL